MGARDLLADLTDAGFTVSADGGRLVIRPASLLTDDLRAAVVAAKPELLALLADELSEGDAARLEARRARLVRWGWPEAEALALAERLRQRDLHADYRHLCVECDHYRPGRCGNHRRADLTKPDIGRELATLLQVCAGFAEDGRRR